MKILMYNKGDKSPDQKNPHLFLQLKIETTFFLFLKVLILSNWSVLFIWHTKHAHMKKRKWQFRMRNVKMKRSFQTNTTQCSSSSSSSFCIDWNRVRTHKYTYKQTCYSICTVFEQYAHACVCVFGTVRHISRTHPSMHPSSFYANEKRTAL